ncbi:MAG: hypothetical protein NZ866_00255, partial [Patescibacteria group bacterium]|nr:hypothetical protein [Patescibacteria group bacterium]
IIIALIFFIIFWQNKKNFNLLSLFYLASSIMIFLGLFSSFLSLIWISLLFSQILIRKKIDLISLSLISYFILLLSVGPGKLSLDRILNLRYF